MEPTKKNFLDMFETNDRRFDSFSEFFSKEEIRADLEETETHYIITAEIPGIHKENIKIEYNRPILKITAIIGKEKEEKTHNYIRKEIPEGAITRRWIMENIIEGTIDAKLKDGILVVELEKDYKKFETGKRIEIK